MSIKKLPDYRLKQKILYIDKTSPETLSEYGGVYLAEGALSDALEFYSKAANKSGLQKIKDIAMNEGDTFLFQQAAKALGEDLQKSDWEDIARRATDLGKYLFAKRALEKTNDKELLNALTAKMKAEETIQSA